MVSPVPRRSAPGQHPRRAAPAEIGFEQRRQRRARGERGQRRGGEARRLTQPVGFAGVNGRGPAQPSDGRPARGPTCPHAPAGAESGEPVAAGSPGRLPAGLEPGEAQRLDHRAGLGPPQPGAAGDDRVRPASVSAPPASGRPSGQQPAPSSRQEPVGAGYGARPRRPARREARKGPCRIRMLRRSFDVLRRPEAQLLRPRKGSGPGLRPAATSASRPI